MIYKHQLSLSLLGLLSLAACAATPSRPNVVLILADDLGIGDPGCYNPASKIPTPNLDRLAAEGMRLTDMHSPSAVCTPTRYGLLCGRYCWRTRLQRGVLDGSSPLLIEKGRMTIPSMLREEGYVTAGIGKWHLGLSNGKTDYSAALTPGPLDVGFDHWFGVSASADMPPYVFIRDRHILAPLTEKIPASAHRRRGGAGYWRGGLAAKGFRHVDILPRVTDEAVLFLEQQQATQGKPFFLYLALPAPHTPWVPARDFLGCSQAGYYGDFTAQVDASIGRILAALDRQGLSQNTLVLATSDNGSHWPLADVRKFGHRANGPYRGQKADIHEGGHRVPCLVRWPSKVQAGSVSEEAACLTDILATLCAVLARPLPEDAGEDSYDLLPVLLGQERHAPVREATVHHSLRGMFAIRQGDWKLILGRGSGGFTRPYSVPKNLRRPGEPDGQLYNLKLDPAETTDLWNEQPGIVEQLQALLQRYRKSGRSR